MAAKNRAQKIINENAVGRWRWVESCSRVLTIAAAVFSKSYCPYCKATKSLLTEMGAKFYTIELDQDGERWVHRASLDRIILTGSL